MFITCGEYQKYEQQRIKSNTTRSRAATGRDGSESASGDDNAEKLPQADGLLGRCIELRIFDGIRD